MSSQPVPLDRAPRPKAIEQQKKAAAQERRSDALYIAGAVLVAAGLGCIRFYLAPIALGVFCLVLPLLELTTGFIRGLRAPGASRR